MLFGVRVLPRGLDGCMNASLKKPYYAVLSFALCLAAIGTVLRTVLLLTDYSESVGQFSSGALSELVFPLIFVLAAILFAGFGFLGRKEMTKGPRCITVPVVFASAFAAVATTVYVITSVRTVIGTDLPTHRIFGILMLLSAIGLAIYFALSALSAGSSSARVISAILAILFCVFYIAFTYFDSSALVLHSPIKILNQLSMLVLTVYFILECRFLFGTAHHAVYLPLGLLALTLTASASIPSLIYAAVKGTALTGNVMHDFMMFALFVYVCANLFAVIERDSESDARGSYAEEIERAGTTSATDLDTHIVSSDPDQESFDFDAVEDAHDAPTDVPSNGEEDGPSDVAQTTLNFKRH